jgi:hypothetical protein
VRDTGVRPGAIADVGLRVEMTVPDRLEQHGARDHLAFVAHRVGEQPIDKPSMPPGSSRSMMIRSQLSLSA